MPIQLTPNAIQRFGFFTKQQAFCALRAVKAALSLLSSLLMVVFLCAMFDFAMHVSITVVYAKLGVNWIGILNIIN